MGNHHDSIALDWVRGEIQDTLTEARHALEAYAGNRDDAARLRFCLNYLHQVHGTLQMVELYGAALLSEEMEALTRAILEDAVSNTDEAVNVLMQAILQLPQYLEHLDSTRDDFPMVLLPLLNDLRAARGEPLLSDTSLFKPDLAPSQVAVSTRSLERFKGPKVAGHLRKLRQMYQFALVGVVREENLAEHFDYIQKVVERLVRLCGDSPRGELWKAAGAFVETLQAGLNPVNSAAKSLLRELDSEIRLLKDQQAAALEQPLPEALFKHLLYYVARARDLDTPGVKALREAYQLDSALPSDEDVDSARTRASSPSRDAIHSVVSALNEELAGLKDQLDLFVRAQSRENSELEELLPGMRQVANTLAVLGLGIPRKVVTEQVELVEKLSAQADGVDDGTLMDIAGALLYVEASLAGLDSERHHEETPAQPDNEDSIDFGSHELGEASAALIRESRNTLEQVKSAIINFIASQWDVREIDHVPSLLHSIRGGLTLVPLNQVASMLASAERYVVDVLLEGKQVPDWKQLDTLADAVTSIEYYLERLAEGISNNEAILRVAEDSLASLGFPVGAEPTWQATAEQEPEDDGEPATESPETGDAVQGSDEELLDDEILEVFIEEAGEVLETIHEYYPRLRQDHEDEEALTEVRRAFHTLKGSGRLVGAISIGEMAWSVENLLNRVIDRSVKPTDDMFTLIDEVNDRIPSLIEEFRTGHGDGDVEHLIARAEALATTRKTEAPETAGEEAPPLAEVVEEAEPGTDAEPAADTVDTAPADGSDDLIDDDILEIFIEEAGEVLETIREYLPMLLRRHDDRSALAEVRRAFHTLKGSGRMVGASTIGELAWAIENMLNRVIDGSIFMNDDIAGLLEEVTAEIPGLVTDFENRRAAGIDTAPLEARANALADGEIPDATLMPEAEPGTATPEDSGVTADAVEETNTDEEEEIDPVLLEIFETETETHLQTIDAFLQEAGDRSSTAYTDELSRALHTLKGSANTAGITPIATVITPLEHFVKEARAQNKRADQDVLQLISDARSFLTRGLAQLNDNPRAPLDGTDEFLERLETVKQTTLHTRQQAEQPTSSTPDSSQLVQLFLGEGLDIVLDAESILEEWSEQPEKRESVDKLHSELEQLSRGASEANLKDVAELADALDAAYTAVAKAGITPDQGFFDTVHSGHEQLINLMDQVAAGLATEPSESLIRNLENLADSIRQDGSASDTDAPAAGTTPEDEAPTPEEPEAAGQEELDDELLEIFLEEARELIDSTGEALQAWSDNTGNTDSLRMLQRDLHTLKGGARLAGIPAVGDFSHELENLFEGLAEQKFTASDDLSDLLFRCHDRLAGMVDALESGEPPRPAPDLIAEIQAFVKGTGAQPEAAEPLPEAEVEETPETTETVSTAPSEPTEDESELDPELVGIFLEEAYDLINSTGSALHAWSEDPSNREVAAELQRDVHTLKGGARMAGADAIGDLSHKLEDLFEKVAGGQLKADAGMLELLFACHDRLAEMVEQVATQKPCPPADELVSQVEAIIKGEVAESSGAEPAPAEPEAPAEAPADDDDALSEMFLDEAREIHDNLAAILEHWREEPEELALLTQLLQELQTLKSGARLADVDPLADLAGAWAQALDQVVAGERQPGPVQTLSDQASQALKGMLDTLAEGGKPAPVPEMIAAFGETPASGEESDKAGAETPRQDTEAPAPTPAPQTEASAGTGKKPKARKTGKAADHQRASQETIRVSAPLLDELVNLAGETSITRGRLEQQTSDFSYTLDEMAATIERLREQLRRMEIETEAQILFRAEQEHGPGYIDDFDPLEMDRYSSIQQLSRALTESTSDLADLRETLSDRVRDTDTLLVQQSRINTELQEGLMKTRMVPFTSMVPRLRRIVRQISGEVGKKVNFDIRNAEGEMDRNILERMVAPLEHMLRNAVDHGIEAPEERQASSKPDTGSLTLSLSREGGDVVLRMTDDGRGIPAGVIRDKAIHQGLMNADEDLSRREILQFILQPGFSTAKKVTQISGRGVGMDVVASEIKELGGSLDIDSTEGQGSTFTVRLPFTVSVNRALMVATGEDFYAIPLNTIEGIVRVSTYELEEYYKPDAPLYEYAGQQYRLQYLGALLNSDHQPKLQGQALPLPVILVRGTEEPVALQVDQLMGSREIVVKSLGPQFNSVRGVSGATILGDGNVVVILDLPAMIRSDMLSERQRLANLEKGRDSARYREQVTRVMVVDDSVTVRKVTSRLLERNGMDVLTAKDGVDAVAQLQDHRPDVILLDIEMPRMDGFEVASFIRHDDTLRETPICMITSRTGEKHRERALAIGVNEYLGKPFQETELLDTIRRLTGEG
ncbi:hybrid sensor histidine kinase/response regulator [Marinobacter oulmenensis]|uniref:Chemotaxis protein CheA n=1 Tax=Marinobacter oulmenensis TaxID=643747 RepID=A0A840U5T1_9GAMM|nr:Hpt domain-containing protein [Marinobacter oulmenensis]MBB5319573.1 chemosensory pili system protein ChpA (sensor histidine kinase/response regulator) [Marinobacter oulmenensis]